VLLLKLVLLLLMLGATLPVRPAQKLMNVYDKYFRSLWLKYCHC
jgi:hypothetical protein